MRQKGVRCTLSAGQGGRAIIINIIILIVVVCIAWVVRTVTSTLRHRDGREYLPRQGSGIFLLVRAEL
jgi:hypothetical protein